MTKLRHMFQTVRECSYKSSKAEDVCFFVRSLTIKKFSEIYHGIVWNFVMMSVRFTSLVAVRGLIT